MRITGGTAKGRRLGVPPSGVRPTQDRLRESLFSSLGGALPGWSVLDLYAGSGALGLEAWSRGAARVVWVERRPRVLRVLRANVRVLCGDDPAFRCLAGDAARPDRLGLGDDAFDLVLADPPYESARGGALLRCLLRGLAAARIVRPGSLAAFEQPASEPAVAEAGWVVLRDRRVGASRWVVYRHAPAAGPGEEST